MNPLHGHTRAGVMCGRRSDAKAGRLQSQSFLSSPTTTPWMRQSFE